MPTDPRGDIAQEPKFDGGTAELVVGPDEVALIVHQDIIRPRSAFFGAALNKCWKEGASMRVALPEDSLGVVTLYVRYLYDGKLYLDRTKGLDRAAAMALIRLEYDALVEAYIFGERIQDVGFRNCIIDAFSARMCEPFGTIHYFPGMEHVDALYQGTSENSLARQLIVEIYISFGKPEWIPGYQLHHNNDFVADIARAAIRGPRGPSVAFSTQALRDFDYSKYYVKDEAVSEGRR
ncbi:hypothetical protein LTR10_003362 [Elasticomyces elasticus]|nr:hypothetical protein LTR10_003362 [Elasticomyces elasticus]KAK4969630.1 hypothetical protein LTR42_008902 [Elasticomyces elasticus]